VLEIPVWGWGAFAALVLVLLAVDLFVHRGGRGQSRRAAIGWTAIWIGAGVAFAGFVHAAFGARPAAEYLGVYFMEKALSVDNMFVFLVILRGLQIDEVAQKRALTWGIVGALIFRALFILAGAAALERWHPLVYVFGAILLVGAYRIAREDPARHSESRLVGWLERHVPLTRTAPPTQFLVRRDGRWLATPLVVALVSIELSDIAFAIDSVPAAFSISSDTFIIYSATVFALVGMRALYAVIATAIGHLRYLHHGLAIILAFAGLKIMTAQWITVPPVLSAAVILGVVTASVVASLWGPWRARRQARRQPGAPRPEPPPQGNEPSAAHSR
jgi:tellurite resistance protein TerC